MKLLRHAGPLAAALGCAIWLAPAASAACKGTDTAALVACIGALEEKVDGLQAEVATLKAEAHRERLSSAKLESAAYVPRMTPNSIVTPAALPANMGFTAPFSVTDAAGNAIFSVVSTGGGGAEVIIGSNNQINLSGKTSGAKVTLGNNAGRVGIWTVDSTESSFALGTFSAATVLLEDLGSSGGQMRVKHGPQGVVMASTTDMAGLTIYTENSQRANFGIPQGKNPGVRIFNAGGQQVAAMGIDSNEGGGAVYLGAGEKNGVTLLSNGSSQGALSLFNGGDTPVIQLRGSDTTIGIFGDGGTPLGALMMSPNSKGGNITLMNSGGQGVVSGGGTTAGDGALCVSRLKNGQTCLGVGLPLR